MENPDRNTAEARNARIRRYARFVAISNAIILSVMVGYGVMLGCALLLLRGTPHSPLVGYASLHAVFVSSSLAAGILAALLECWNARRSGFRPRAAEIGCLVAWGCFLLMICTSGRDAVSKLPWFLLGLFADIPVLSLAGVFGWHISKRISAENEADG